MHSALEALRQELFMTEREFRIGFPVFLAAMALLLVNTHIFQGTYEVVKWTGIAAGIVFCATMIRPMIRIVGNWVYIKRWLKHEEPETQRYVKSRIWLEVSFVIGMVLCGAGGYNGIILGDYIWLALLIPGGFLVIQYMYMKDSDLWNKK